MNKSENNALFTRISLFSFTLEPAHPPLLSLPLYLAHWRADSELCVFTNTKFLHAKDLGLRVEEEASEVVYDIITQELKNQHLDIWLKH